MAPPSSSKYLVQVDRSKTKTIKFKNGFPPKIIRPKDSIEETAEREPHQRLQLLECDIPLKKGPTVVVQRNARRLLNTQPSQTNVNSSIPPTGTRRGFIPSFVKHGVPKQGKTRQAPFSPPPTMTELRSLTKKIGRFYTLKNGSGSPSSQPSSRVPSQQRVILDIERALSAKDVSGLEKCYKRIFHKSEFTKPAKSPSHSPARAARVSFCKFFTIGIYTKHRESETTKKVVIGKCR
eukprot:Seg2271.3 transcript_id=Seg2271.3/GoldUCD/mRNA.D3Y31 product="hypothetical protein" protein_id=Seg2271.3/GoldUCD/D3Y31